MLVMMLRESSKDRTLVLSKNFQDNEKDKIYDVLLSELKKEFDKYRNDKTILADPDLKEGEVMKLENDTDFYSWAVWIMDIDNNFSQLSKVNINLFTDLVLETRRFDSEWIGQQMMEQDPVLQMLRHAPTSMPDKSKSSNGYVIGNY